MKPAFPPSNARRLRPSGRLLALACWTLALVLLASCASADRGADANPPAREAVLLWHNLPEAEAAALDNIVNRYRRANPEVEVIVQAHGADIDQSFERATRSGLGPNLLLTGSAGLRELVATGSILPLDERVSAEELARYLTVALRTLQVDGQIYGLPMTVDTQVLYYNRALSDQPPAAIDKLMQAVNSGERVLMNSQFPDMLWTARAFGVELFDSQNNPQDTTASIANWLGSLEQMRDTPGFILDDDSEALRSRFLEGDIPYYVGRTEEMNQLIAGLGANLGVAQLPAGPAGSAGPPLTTTALLVNALSSERQTQRALDLARFITSSDQQAALMREANVAPANSRTRISEGLYPRIATVTAQARTSIPLSNEQVVVDAHGVLATAFNRTMTGMASASEAAASAQATLIEEFGFPGGGLDEATCKERGRLTLLAPASPDQQAIMRTLVDGFAALCPGITVTIQAAPLGESLAGEAFDAVQMDALVAAADLLFLPHSYLPALAEAGLIAPVEGLLDLALVQQMRPLTVQAMRSGEELYGVPLFVDLQVLYHNRELVRDPAGTLTDLRAQAQAGAPVVLDGSFAWGFWGVGAFGGQLFGPQGEFVLSPAAFTRWLAWLQESGQRFGVRTTPARSEARQLFVTGASAYYVATSVELADLAARLGEEALAVALMPQGPAGPGRPLAQVDGLMASAALTAEQAALAARFLSYAASAPAQTLLLDRYQLLPANSAVQLMSYPNVMRIAVQAQSSALLQDTPWLAAVVELGDEAYRQVLQEGVAPAVAVGQMYEALAAEAERTGFTLPTPEPTPTATPDSATPAPASTPAADTDETSSPTPASNDAP